MSLWGLEYDLLSFRSITYDELRQTCSCECDLWSTYPGSAEFGVWGSPTSYTKHSPFSRATHDPCVQLEQFDWEYDS